MGKYYIAHCVSGYYGYDRKVFVSKKLNAMPYAQAGIIEGSNNVKQLISYETIVAEIDNNWLHVYGLFSRTTIKHISAFLKECAPSLSYYDAKKAYKNDIEINIVTGETRQAHNRIIQTVGVRV